jgi:uncharacterized Tic20 family protein
MNDMSDTSQQPPYPGPQPMSPQDERLWSTLIHLSPFLLGFVGPLVGYLVLKERGAYVRHHTAQALNFALTYLIVAAVIAVLSFVTLGIATVLYLPLAVLQLVFMIMAAVAANRGEYYRYPLTITFVS